MYEQSKSLAFIYLLEFGGGLEHRHGKSSSLNGERLLALCKPYFILYYTRQVTQVLQHTMHKIYQNLTTAHARSHLSILHDLK